MWRWDQQEPFGNNVPDENPSGLGAFDLPLRLPGQYFDKETGLHYNYFRDYDASIGRYGESDPAGLEPDLNTYAYVRSDPLRLFDEEGLQAGAIPRPGSAPFPGIPGATYTPPNDAASREAEAAAAQGGITRNERDRPDGRPDRPGDSSASASDRSIKYPDKKARKWACTARADCDDRIPGNCPPEPEKQFAFGSGVDRSLGTARNLAKRDATHRLGCQPKYVSCKCTGPKGERYSGGC